MAFWNGGGWGVSRWTCFWGSFLTRFWQILNSKLKENRQKTAKKTAKKHPKNAKNCNVKPPNSNQRTNLDGITLHSGSVRTYCIGSCVTTMCTAMRSHALEARRKVSFSTARMDNGKWHDMTRKTLTVIRGIPRNFDSEVALRLTKFF